ncbi:hypothetical protein [Thalassospira sp. TSL5-1]|uniref:hypothetical protein n=1 Tax=Thalassospira sp. TSL5-1 TaxID=1544451 RepID=UPI00093A37DE|nr:hypothetical protein [Thalassospira sp. TSL5-1]OKH87472.1 hypothetical protein LF95_11770 [Thalassospira sp. TSL5-1]
MPDKTAQSGKELPQTKEHEHNTSFATQNIPAPGTGNGFMRQLVAFLYRYRFLCLMLWALAMVAIGYAGIERRFAVTDKHNLDKFVHVGVFAAMAFWPIMVCGWRKTGLFFALLVILGAPGLELMQAHFGNGRIASLADMTASLSGAAAGMVLAALVRRTG